MTSSSSLNDLSTLTKQLKQSQYDYNEDLGAAFFYMCPQPRPCFNPELLRELRLFQKAAARQIVMDKRLQHEPKLKYTVLASTFPGVFNLGGDLNLFQDIIQKQDRDTLYRYASSCIDIVHQMSISLKSPLTTIALIQGSAQGGGLEAALSCNIIIAERGTLLGFPEVLFNLFPGMGAYSFLRQRVNSVLAEQIILSGKLYRAEELHELGIVDILAEPGKGTTALEDYIHQSNKRSNAQALIRHTRNNYNEASYDELLEITNMWVDSAMNISAKDLKTMGRLVRAQNYKFKQLPDKDQRLVK